jgi:hypothetical protein
MGRAAMIAHSFIIILYAFNYPPVPRRVPPPHDCLAQGHHGTSPGAFPLSIAGVAMMDMARKLIRGVHRAIATPAQPRTRYERPLAVPKSVSNPPAAAAFTPLAHLCHLSRDSAELGYACICYHGTQVQYVRKSADRGYARPVYPRASTTLPGAADRRGNTTLLLPRCADTAPNVSEDRGSAGHV